MRFALCLLFLISSIVVFGQEEEELVFGNTNKTSNKPKYGSSKKSKERKTLLLIRMNPRKVLDGNKCFKEYQQSISVRVAKLAKGEPGNYNALSRWVNNTSTRVKGTFRLGPFWVMRLNKRMRNCRDTLHDFIG